MHVSEAHFLMELFYYSKHESHKKVLEFHVMSKPIIYMDLCYLAVLQLQRRAFLFPRIPPFL